MEKYFPRKDQKEETVKNSGFYFLGQPEFNTAPDEGSAGYAEGKTLTLNYGFGFGFI